MLKGWCNYFCITFLQFSGIGLEVLCEFEAILLLNYFLNVLKLFGLIVFITLFILIVKSSQVAFNKNQ